MWIFPVLLCCAVPGRLSQWMAVWGRGDVFSADRRRHVIGPHGELFPVSGANVALSPGSRDTSPASLLTGQLQHSSFCRPCNTNTANADIFLVR